MRIISYVLVLLLFVTQLAKADYLVVSRAATIKEKPSGSATILGRVAEGQILLLLQDKQSPSGYFKVKDPDQDIEGWIFRSLVRRHAGDAPGFPADDSTGPVARSDGDLIVTIVDVGAGLCTVSKLPDGRFILYDLGDKTGGGEDVYEQISEIVPPGSPIELLVISHTDADHVGSAKQVLERYRVKKIIHTGFEKKMVVNVKRTQTLQRFYDALENLPYPIENINLNERDSLIRPGTTLKFGKVRAVFLCGFGEPLAEWKMGASDYSKRVNGVSIVMKLEYAGKSILFGGDAVGRFDDKKPIPPDDLQGTEKFMINSAAQWLDSDVVIAPHHGADNGSSKAFIEATTPEFVIFSAGHDHRHPRQATADRYIQAGVKLKNIFRTDRGDDERSEDYNDEWSAGRTDGCSDKAGDDDVEIFIAADGKIKVRYKFPEVPCEPEESDED